MLRSRTEIKVLLLLLASIFSVSPWAAAQSTLPPIEVGVKVPLAGLLSFRASDQVRLELSAVLPGFSSPLVGFEGALTAKLYPTGAISIKDLPTHPYVGGGALFISSLGGFVPGIVGVLGAEFEAPNLPLMAFIEGSISLPMTGDTTTVVFQLSLGARYSFSHQ
ncbi:hypothetical protein HY229_06865 [Candidatus Acetothermia bacterium]|nr:hypothetical protein [Candidatus Acetothermia bacterium]MBI3643805.1 hypothetical protein [Candidatus Acetothermia bacterium]